MGSIPDDKQLARRVEVAAKEIAVQFRLWWRLSDLRMHGWNGVREAKTKHDERLSTPFPRFALRYINEETRRGADKIMRTQKDTKPANRTPPSEERIRDALETFSILEWVPLIAEFGREDLDLLSHYLLTNRGELERSPDWEKKYKGLTAHAIQRNIDLLLSHPNLRVTNVTGPMWAEVWRQYSRAKNLEGAPRPSKRRSWMEMASARGVAEALSQHGHKVDRRKVEKWFERIDLEPFEEFAGTPYEYWLYISDPEAYKRHRERLRSAREGDEE